MLMMCVMFLHCIPFFHSLSASAFRNLRFLCAFFTSLNCSGFFTTTAATANTIMRVKVNNYKIVVGRICLWARTRRMTISSFVFADTDPESCETISKKQLTAEREKWNCEMMCTHSTYILHAGHKLFCCWPFFWHVSNKKLSLPKMRYKCCTFIKHFYWRHHHRWRDILLYRSHL